MTRSLRLAALSLLVITSACGGSATMMRSSMNGGSVQLSGAFMPAVMEAKLLMADHCDGRFKAVEHGDRLDFRCDANASIAMQGARSGL